MEGIRVDIILNEVVHGLWRMPQVPSVGELMWVGNIDAVARGSAERAHAGWAKVEQVRWVGDGGGGVHHVDVHVSKMPE